SGSSTSTGRSCASRRRTSRCRRRTRSKTSRSPRSTRSSAGCARRWTDGNASSVDGGHGARRRNAMTDRILIRGGHVLTGDPELGDLSGGDVLIEDDRIAEVGRDLSADAEVIDATGCIVIPGFVDSHRHTWETAIRSCAPNSTLDDYFVGVLDSFAPLYRP